MHKDISVVHSGISKKLNDWLPSVWLSWPYALFAETNAVWGSAGNEATVATAELMCLSSFQKPQ